VAGIESEYDVSDPVASPELSDAQLTRLRSYRTPQAVEAGDVLYGPRDATYDLIVTGDASVEIVQQATADVPTESLVRFGPGSFLGELNLLTGQAVYLIARVTEAGHVHRIAPFDEARGRGGRRGRKRRSVGAHRNRRQGMMQAA
jgi:thioredoxin reductase (NADPH)